MGSATQSVFEEHLWLAWLAKVRILILTLLLAIELAVAQLVPQLVLPLALPLLEPDELQPTVSSRLPATAAAAAIACRALKFPSQATVPAGGDHNANLG